MTPVKTLIFDLGKVLVDFDNDLIIERMARRSARSIGEIRSFVFTTDLIRRLDTGKITPRGFFEAAAAELSLSLSYEEFVPLWCDIFTPIPGMEELVGRLAKNHRLALLSNTNELHFEFIRNRFPVLGHFSDFFLSYREGRAKPDPELYRSVVDACRVAPSELFYTDDIPEYVAAARAAGINAAVFTSPGCLIKDLRACGIPL